MPGLYRWSPGFLLLVKCIPRKISCSSVSNDIRSMHAVPSNNSFSFSLCSQLGHVKVMGYYWSTLGFVVVKFSSESNSLGVEIEATEQIHLKQNTRVVISRLKLHNIHPRSHRASYRCVASNSYNSTSSEYYLRVRDRTAWVIPLIGILIQISVIALSVSFCKLSKRGEITMTARSGQDETDEKLMTTASQISTMESRSPPK